MQYLVRRIRIWSLAILRRSTKLFSKRLVYFEGGLGSQIISYILVQNLLKRKIKPLIDFSYFDFKDVDQGIIKWHWELDHYGIQEIEFRSNFDQSFIDKSLLRIARITRNFSGRSICENNLIEETNFDEISRQLGISEDAYILLDQLQIKPYKFSVIHLRKGDYLTVSSRVIEIEEVLNFLHKFNHLEFGQMIIISDGNLDPEEVTKIRDSVMLSSALLLQGSLYAAHSLHGMMRLAKILVTSNSTFSWTAGVLNRNPDAIIFSPTNFFNNSINDRLFQLSSNWMIIN